jgi:hypothetical protein
MNLSTFVGESAYSTSFSAGAEHAHAHKGGGGFDQVRLCPSPLPCLALK